MPNVDARHYKGMALNSAAHTLIAYEGIGLCDRMLMDMTGMRLISLLQREKKLYTHTVEAFSIGTKKSKSLYILCYKFKF